VSGSCGLRQEVTCMGAGPVGPIGVVFDDECVVVNAGIVLGRRLGIESVIDAAVRLGGRPRLRPGGKVAV
jgi:hypothetical protein